MLRPAFFYLSLFLLFTGRVSAQSATHALSLESPQPNEEVCLGASLPISAIVTNTDSISRTLVAHFEIHNVVTGVTIESVWDTLPSVGPGASFNTTFAPFVTNTNILSQLGAHRATMTLLALDNNGNIITNWPFIDSVSVRVFGIRRTASPFRDLSNAYSKTLSGDIPDQYWWVSLGASVADGDIATWDPPPPRDRAGQGFGPDNLRSPVIRIDRSDVNGQVYEGADAGDTLTSAPINLLNQTRAVLTFEFMRGGKQRYPGLWDKQTMTAPEQTVMDRNGNILRSGDSLILEFKAPTSGACNPDTWNRIFAIDGGRDFEFQSFWVMIDSAKGVCHLSLDPSQSIIPLDGNYFGVDFRFRLRLKAKDNASGAVRDDDDPWFLDNLDLFVPRKPETEISWVRVVTPYTKLPYGAIGHLPVYVKVRNTSVNTQQVPVKVEILNNFGAACYSQTITVSGLATGQDSILRMPDWDARKCPYDNDYPFVVKASLAISGFDSYDEDNETFTHFYLNVEPGSGIFGQDFAWDDAGLTPQVQSGNDVPFFTGVTGNGLGFSNTTGSFAVKFVLPSTDTCYGTRVYFANGNQADDAIHISLLKGDSNSCIPGDTLQIDRTQTTFRDTRGGELFNKFWPFYFPKPIVLHPGVYWISVSQLTPDNMMMGGDVSRGSGEVRIADPAASEIVPVYSSKYGTQWSPADNNGDVSCAFAVEVPAGSKNWQPWVSNTSWWPTNISGATHQASAWDPQMKAPFTMGGSFMPMIRLMMHHMEQPPFRVAVQNARSFGLASNPNPFVTSAGYVDLSFTLPERADVSLVIYDALGRTVRTLAKESFDAGAHTVHWNGRDAQALAVTHGSYLARLTAAERSEAVKIMVVR